MSRDSNIVQQPKASDAGLTSTEASQRLEDLGANELTPKQSSGNVSQLLRLFANPLVLILIAVSIISRLVGELVNAGLVLAIVLLSVIINFIQTYRSQHAIEKLKKGVTPTATVLRDGEWQEIHREEVVPGDIVRLSAGDLVPADGRLIEARDLHAQEACRLRKRLSVS